MLHRKVNSSPPPSISYTFSPVSVSDCEEAHISLSIAMADNEDHDSLIRDFRGITGASPQQVGV